MNERIKELAKQAGLSYLYDYDADGHAMVCSEKDIKKFAELIVRECVHIALKDALPDWDRSALEASAQCVKIAADLKQHFGVEE